MKIEYINEILLDFYEFDIEIPENKSDELIIYNKDEFYEIDEILSENAFSYEIKSEYYDYMILKFNLECNKSEIRSYDALLRNKKENELYLRLLKNDSDYKKASNEIGMNALTDAMHKFYFNHKNFNSYNLDENYNDAYELLDELLSDSSVYDKFKYTIYENLDEFYEYEYIENYSKYTIILSDENNILIDPIGQLRNINESDIKSVLKCYIKENFFYENEIDLNKLDSFIELVNVFNEYNSYEILSNTEYNLKYIFNKLLISFNSFKSYKNSDEYILLKYNESNKNESLSENDIVKISNELLDALIDASMYYEYDSYEFNEFRKYLNLLS